MTKTDGAKRIQAPLARRVWIILDVSPALTACFREKTRYWRATHCRESGPDPCHEDGLIASARSTPRSIVHRGGGPTTGWQTT